MVPSSPRPLLRLFTPLAPQRNGLADYIAQYLPMLARDFALEVVVEAGLAEAAAADPGLPAGVVVRDECALLADPTADQGLRLYNLGNNADCVWMLDLLHRLRGAVIVHDISLLYLHQLSARGHHTPGLLGAWLADDGHAVPADFLARDGQLLRSPVLVYQECLMLRRIADSARAVMVHSAYAERRLRAACEGVAFGAARPLLRLPHFVLPPPPPGPADVLATLGLGDADTVVLVPGFLTGNKMLWEVLSAFREAQPRAPGLRLVFAGEERAQEYDLSRRIAALWPAGDGPQVTGYLEAPALDALLARADLSLVLRHPTYGESSGLLPRAAMDGGEVLTVDAGAYAEFRAEGVQHLPIGPGLVAGLREAMVRVAAQARDPAARAARRAQALAAAAQATPAALYPALRDWLHRSGEGA